MKIPVFKKFFKRRQFQKVSGKLEKTLESANSHRQI